MNIEMRRREEVIPYGRNPRKNDLSVEKVAASIKAFGFKQPIVVDEDGVILAGHTRLKAAEQLGIEEVPVIVARGLTDQQEKAYRLADNKTAELSSWDPDRLKEEVESLDLEELSKYGFDFALDDYDTFLEEQLQALLNAADTEPVVFPITFRIPNDYEEDVKGILRKEGEGWIAGQLGERARGRGYGD